MPSSIQLHVSPLLDHPMVNSVDVVPPLAGEIEVEQVGAPSPDTMTVLEKHVLVPPSAVAVSVTKWLPGRNILSLEPRHVTSPWSTPSIAQ